MRHLGILMALALVLLAAAVPAPAKDLGRVQTTCTRCHSTERICRNIAAVRSEEWWTGTVTRMRGNGAKVEKAEIPAFAAWLAGSPERDRLCKD